MGNKKSPSQIGQDLELLKSLGYAIPLPALAYVKQQELKGRGVVQYWMCSKCGFKYEALVKITDLRCPKEHVVRKVWDL